MKEGWEYKKLGETCNIDFGTRVVRSRDAGSIYPVYGGGGATFKMDMYNREDCMVISRFGMSEQCTRFVKGKFFLNDSGLTLSMKENCLIQEFMDWQILYLNNTIYSLGRGAAQKNLDTKALAEVRITYPNNLSEQQSIVDYLDSAFAKIDAMKANAEKALNEAKALFQASLKEMLEPKDGWEEKNLIKEFSLKSGENLSAKNHVIGPYPVYGGNGITGYHNQYNLSGDQILIGRVGALCGNIHYIKERIWVTDNAFVVNNISSSWNMLFLSYELEYINLNQYASQTAQPVISNKSMKDVSIFQPPLSEQQSIVATLDALKSKVDRLQENYDKISQECDALKQALLKEVFEG